MLSTLLTIAGVHIIALASPGPDTFIVMQTAASKSRKEAMMCVLGITAGVAVWAAVSLLGLQWLFDQFAWLHKTIMLMGGIYLGWMGIKILKSSLKASSSAAGDSPLGTQEDKSKSFLTGLFTNLANAKALVYFSSVFALFIKPDMDWTQSLPIFLLVITETFLWFSVVGLLIGLPKPKRIYQSAGKWIDGACGAIFGVFGGGLIYSALKE